MKKILIFVFLGLILFTETTIAKSTKWVKGGIYENEVTWRNIKIKLPQGKLELIDKYHWTSWGVEVKSVELVNLKDNTINKLFAIGEMGSWTYQSQVRQILHEFLYMNRYDGCYPRSEYTVMKVKKKAAFNNCFIVRHIDTQKEIYYPDDPKDFSSRLIKLWIEKNDVTVPPILLCSNHLFMAPSVISNLIGIDYCINPELNGGTKTKFNTEESNEYHPSNIHQYPNMKKYMEEWVKLSAQRHKSFEKNLGAKVRHKLDLSEFGVSDIIPKTKNTSLDSNFINEIKQLKKLYDEGVLNEEEFNKAKKKILN
jgi:hypothetical protein